jgi:hypothetical protein
LRTGGNCAAIHVHPRDRRLTAFKLNSSANAKKAHDWDQHEIDVSGRAYSYRLFAIASLSGTDCR